MGPPTQLKVGQGQAKAFRETRKENTQKTWQRKATKRERPNQILVENIPEQKRYR